jgi:hypothetical protein
MACRTPEEYVMNQCEQRKPKVSSITAILSASDRRMLEASLRTSGLEYEMRKILNVEDLTLRLIHLG